MKHSLHKSAPTRDPIAPGGAPTSPGDAPPAPDLTPIFKQRDYRLLWTARTISITGSEVSKLAVPLTAVTLLAASPMEMGLLTGAASLPALLLGLQSGAIADRLSRHRPLMIACELVSC